MQTVDEQPETIHLYVVREEEPKPPVFPIVLSALSLVVLLVFCVLAPYQQPVTRAVIRVPAVLLPIQPFTATAAIIPTGIKVYPATISHGWITFTNGSIIGQDIPAGFTIDGIATDKAVYLPPGNANGYGRAVVAAHALTSGVAGNIPALTLNNVVGSSVYVCNLEAFQGGRNAYSVTFITSNDRNVALSKVRNILISKSAGLHYPCTENQFHDVVKMVLTWRCQFVTYHIPAFYHVAGVRIIGKNLLISVWFVARPAHVWVK
jgi:hypothetical protein